ncbi:hypothetical protein COS61_01440 [Candidatus Wolfebacteria bacterium CG03_land_8_20_14_0_80_40_12]|uniref:Zinc finger DksA/TraR C4-type domain-containing protein n=1 Tax=Candidatus Wolfebacteria bacterium CG03_land_8_20_14_0_80_40_12 TaxID=1975069 RepID=A0A2M7B5R4_9BACT|nr:MAG: hypothetical protein COS61_01440 [Candidatus Wolfebacteria bacterium CG03_land_8_20_14_0_80_40_12]
MDLIFSEKFKKILLKSGKEIKNKIKELQKMPDFGSDVDPDEETDESEQLGSQLAIIQNYKEHLADINLALSKIEKNKYGICEKCRKEILLDVLEAAPESKLCKECKIPF